MHAILFAFAAIVIVGTTAGIGWAVGRTAAVRDTPAYRKGRAAGYRQGFAQAEFDAALDALTGYDARAVAEEALDLRTGHRDHEEDR